MINFSSRPALYCLAAVGIICLSACGAKKDYTDFFAGKMRDTFVSQIKQDGLKLFTYQADFVTDDQQGNRGDSAREENKSPQHKPQQQSGSKRQKQPNQKKRRTSTSELQEAWIEQVELGLSKTLAMTGFCRTGYIELDRYIGETHAEIRGECNEGATGDDHASFGQNRS